MSHDKNHRGRCPRRHLFMKVRLATLLWSKINYYMALVLLLSVPYSYTSLIQKKSTIFEFDSRAILFVLLSMRCNDIWPSQNQWIKGGEGERGAVL